MSRNLRFAFWISLAGAAAMCVVGFHLMLTPGIPVVSAAVAGAQDQAPPDQGQDPAEVNMAPSGPSYTTEAPPPEQAGPPPGPDDQYYADQPTETADEPPPPLPVYEQPPPPGDGYIWAPGYWAWGPAGYYWVPGAWVEAPYMGALWTPGYWGFYGGRYLFYPGHWGLHIGFYGGINYGFGYLGYGYEGGYWNSGRFFYNRAYNHINERVVHNVYEYHARERNNDGFRGDHNQRNNNAPGGNYGQRNNNAPGGNDGQRNNNAPGGNYNQRNNNAPGGNDGQRNNNAPGGNYNSRTSYRGGPGGVQSHPQPSEGAAWHEPTAPRMNTQVRQAQTYQTNRGQLATQNHGQPRTPAVSHPVPAEHNVKPTVRTNSHGGGWPQPQQHH